MTTERKPTGLQMLWGMGDWPEFEKYQSRGGGKGYEDWKRSGKPPPPAQLTPYARSILERTGGVPPGVTTREGGLPSVGQRVGTQQAEREVAGIDLTGGIKPAVRWDTVSQAGWDYDVGYDSEGNVVSRDRAGRTQTEDDMPEGMWRTFEEATKGAPQGYRPKQTPEGWWDMPVPVPPPMRVLKPASQSQQPWLLHQVSQPCQPNPKHLNPRSLMR